MVHLPTQIACILLYGSELRLVETRSGVLEKEGLRVLAVLRLSDLLRIVLEEPVDLFLLCDSLPEDARSEGLCLINSSWPGAERLVLAPASLPVDREPNERIFPAMEGPAKLVKAIRTLIVNGSAAA